APVERIPSPCMTMLKAVGVCPLVVKARLSEERYVPPDADRIAPPVAAELSQPCPGPAGGLGHGQAMTPPTPGSHRLVKVGPPTRSRTNASTLAFVSSGTRFDARLSNAMNRPSAEIAGPA